MGEELWKHCRELVISQYAESVNLLAVAQAAVESLQPSADSSARIAEALSMERVKLGDKEYGAWLDLIGSYRNVRRLAGESDDDYKARMLAAFKANTAGTPDNVISNISEITGDPNPQYMEEMPATFFVYTPESTGDRAATTGQVKKYSPAGVLGLPGAALDAACDKTTRLATADGKVLLVVARDIKE